MYTLRIQHRKRPDTTVTSLQQKICFIYNLLLIKLIVSGQNDSIL